MAGCRGGISQRAWRVNSRRHDPKDPKMQGQKGAGWRSCQEPKEEKSFGRREGGFQECGEIGTKPGVPGGRDESRKVSIGLPGEEITSDLLRYQHVLLSECGHLCARCEPNAQPMRRMAKRALPKERSHFLICNINATKV